MARPRKAAKSEAVTAAEGNGASIGDIGAIEDGKIFDYITGKPVAENDKEHVRQRIARALFHEYGISVDDMEPDFKVKVDGSNKKIDIAIFEPGSDHTSENVRRLVVCQKELKVGDRGAVKMRDHEQAAKDLEVLKAAMAACESCKYGLWTNGLEFFFFRVERTRFDVKFKPIGDGRHVVVLLDQLRYLSGRLALKLISSPTQRAEALGLALSRLYLEHQGVFENQVVVPLDAHLELYRVLKAHANELGDEVSFRRTDLGLFDLDLARRTITCRLVEVKCYAGVGDIAQYNTLKASIAEQIAESEQVIAHHFDPQRTPLDRPDRAFKTRELALLLEFYLERAERYGAISREAADEARYFVHRAKAHLLHRFVKPDASLLRDAGQRSVRIIVPCSESLQR